jgi:hypothetical protein
MNWREIFKRTGYILIVASILTLLRWFGLRDFERDYLIPSAMIVVVVINLIGMSEYVTPHRRTEHALLILFLSWISALPLSIFLLGVPLWEYIRFGFWISLIGLIIAWIFTAMIDRDISRGESIYFTRMTPEQVIKHLGQPRETISLESGMTYVFNRTRN